MNKRIAETREETIKQGGLFSIYIYGYLSIYLVRISSFCNFTPNQLTVFGLLLTVISSFFFMSSHAYHQLTGLVLLNIGEIFDYADGQLAFYLNKRTKLGAFLDPFFDRVGDIIVLGGISFSYLQTNKSIGVLILYLFWVALLFLCNVIDNSINSLPNSGVSNGVENLRKIKSYFPKKIRTLIRWDGGFDVFLISFCVVFNLIPLLLLTKIAILLLPHVYSLNQLIVFLKKE